MWENMFTQKCDVRLDARQFSSTEISTFTVLQCFYVSLPMRGFEPTSAPSQGEAITPFPPPIVTDNNGGALAFSPPHFLHFYNALDLAGCSCFVIFMGVCIKVNVHFGLSVLWVTPCPHFLWVWVWVWGGGGVIVGRHRILGRRCTQH